MKKIPCSLPSAQFHSHREEILEAVARVCENGQYILGPEVVAFEKDFSAYHGVNHAVGVGSGTDAIALTLKAFGIGVGDEVITVSHTALATVAAIAMAGATPVLIDVDPAYYTMDPEKIEEVITPATKAIIAVHLYGQPCDMAAILSIARKRKLRVFEDCAQAHGAEYDGRKVGTLGDAGCFSFYPTKNLGAIGDGGAVITRDKGVAERVRRLRQYGWDQSRTSQEPGVVSRLDEMQAAILRVKLKHLDADNRARERIAKLYSEGLSHSSVRVPLVRSRARHVFHLYVIQTAKRDALREYLAREGIEAGIHYPRPSHLHPGYSKAVVLPKSGLPGTEAISKQVLSLPIYPELEAQDITRVINGVKSYQ